MSASTPNHIPVRILTTRVPLWSRKSAANVCGGSEVRVPHGTPGHIIAGTTERPLIRTFVHRPRRGFVPAYGWLMPGDFEVTK